MLGLQQKWPRHSLHHVPHTPSFSCVPGRFGSKLGKRTVKNDMNSGSTTVTIPTSSQLPLGTGTGALPENEPGAGFVWWAEWQQAANHHFYSDSLMSRAPGSALGWGRRGADRRKRKETGDTKSAPCPQAPGDTRGWVTGLEVAPAVRAESIRTQTTATREAGAVGKLRHRAGQAAAGWGGGVARERPGRGQAAQAADTVTGAGRPLGGRTGGKEDEAHLAVTSEHRGTSGAVSDGCWGHKHRELLT